MKEGEQNWSQHGALLGPVFYRTSSTGRMQEVGVESKRSAQVADGVKEKVGDGEKPGEREKKM